MVQCAENMVEIPSKFGLLHSPQRTRNTAEDAIASPLVQQKILRAGMKMHGKQDTWTIDELFNAMVREKVVTQKEKTAVYANVAQLQGRGLVFFESWGNPQIPDEPLEQKRVHYKIPR